MDMGEILSELNREGSITVASGSPEETFALGKMLGGQSRAGTVFTLTGDLGAGKTVFAQGFAAGLGIGEPVNSPTFTILQVYEGGRLPFYHFDVYRIADVEEMDEIGYEDRRCLPDRMGGYDRRDIAGIPYTDNDNKGSGKRIRSSQHQCEAGKISGISIGGSG